MLTELGHDPLIGAAQGCMMRIRLTRRLGGIIFTLLFGSAPLVTAAEAQGSLSGNEQARYLADLQRLYLAKSERAALLEHCNQLLQTYALRAGYQVGQAAPRDLFYQLSLGGPGELLLREESRGQQGTDISVRNRSLSVFGLDPYIRYDCPLSGIRCVLHNPADGTPLLSVLRDQQGAEELAKALSFLLRNLQQN